MAEETRRIKMINTANTGRGTVFDKHKEYVVSPRTAEVFIAKGHAEDAYDVFCEKLKEFGGGLVVFADETDPQLVDAAKRNKVRVSKARKRAPAKK